MMKNTKFEPLVSIIIPVYNGEDYVCEAINSALAQSYKNVEVIVVNDGSKDGTDELIKSKYGKKVRYFSKENGGVSTALNYGIDKMKGEYFSWLSHDDVYLPNKIDEQIKFISNFNNKNIIPFCDFMLIDSNGKNYPKAYILDSSLFEGKREYPLLRGVISGITLLIPKKAFDECGNFNTELKCTQDYDLWFRMLKKYDFVYMKGVYTKTRIHPGQDTQKNPRVIEEGNTLWMKFVESINDKRKIELEGSIFNYYYEFALYLKRTFHKEVMNYCISKCKEIDEETYLKNDIANIKGESIPKKIFRHIKNDGLIGSFKIMLLRRKRVRINEKRDK